MSRNRDRKGPVASSRPTEMDEARNELFGHIHRCGVLRATEEQQVEWMAETIDFLGERYPSLSAEQKEELKEIGLRFCRPVIANNTATETEEAEATAA